MREIRIERALLRGRALRGVSRSEVELVFCKPLVGSSNLSPGTAFPPAPRGAGLLRDHDAVRVLAHALDRLLREARGLYVGDEGLGIFGHRSRRAFRIADGDRHVV